MASTQGMLRQLSLRRRSVAPGNQATSSDLNDGMLRQASSVHGGLRSAKIFTEMNCTEEVAEWLRIIGMETYIATFQERSVTGDILLSLNSVELEKALGVTKLRDRRYLLNSINYLKQVLCVETKRVTPEDGRILTHLSSERLYLLWARVSVILQTVALATLRLTSPLKENEPQVLRFAYSLAVLSVLAILYAAVTYFRTLHIADDPGTDYFPRNVVGLVPTAFLCIGVAMTFFVMMAQSTEEAAVLALIVA